MLNLVFSFCELQGIEIVIINKGEQPSFEEELAQDVLEIITVFSARLYGSRSKKHKNYYWDDKRKSLKLLERLIIMVLGLKTELYPNNSQKT